MSNLLSDEDIATGLSTLPEWHRDGGSITRTARLATFRDAIAAVDAVADRAEAADHHPDIDIRYRTLTFTLSTHSAGGLTQNDLDLAGEIDAVLNQ